MKLPCPMIQDLLPLYADEICSAESRALVEKHLCDCDTCVKKLQALRQTDSEDEKALTQAAAAAWQQSKRKSIVKTIVILLAAVCLFAAVFVLPYTRWGAETTVRIWEKQLTEYAQTQLSSENLSYGHIEFVPCMEYTVEISSFSNSVFFTYETGTGQRGFFYSASGEPVARLNWYMSYKPDGNGWRSGSMYAERITGNWYWFEIR